MSEIIFHRVARNDTGRVVVEAQKSTKANSFVFGTGASGYSQAIEIADGDLELLAEIVAEAMASRAS